uniref:Rnb-domain-containing protein n=1 Tax=Tetraselmis sp. GSL018 TaxID=582737 RepID=A0A061RCI7_9CHLO
MYRFRKKLAGVVTLSVASSPSMLSQSLRNSVGPASALPWVYAVLATAEGSVQTFPAEAAQLHSYSCPADGENPPAVRSLNNLNCGQGESALTGTRGLATDANLHGAVDRVTTKSSTSRYSNVIWNPYINKGTNFSEAERLSNSLRGVLPYKFETLELQAERVMLELRDGKKSPLDKYISLMQVAANSLRLFYKVLFRLPKLFWDIKLGGKVQEICCSLAKLREYPSRQQASRLSSASRFCFPTASGNTKLSTIIFPLCKFGRAGSSNLQEACLTIREWKQRRNK